MDKFEYKITLNDISFRYAKGESLEKGDEIHNFNEILFFLKGGATFLSEKFEEPLNEYSLLIIPAGSYHKFKIDNQEEYTRVVFNFPSKETRLPLFDEIRIFSLLDDDILRLLNRLKEKMSTKEISEKKNHWLLSAFHMLLSELENSTLLDFSPPLRQQNLLISRCIEYIDKNLNTKLTVEEISKKMGASVSTLHIGFKKHLGISVYKYINEKRLIKANSLIALGENPTKIFMSCGFSDYPSFYKAYIKKFGRKPSDDKKALSQTQLE